MKALFSQTRTGTEEKVHGPFHSLAPGTDEAAKTPSVVRLGRGDLQRPP